MKSVPLSITVDRPGAAEWRLAEGSIDLAREYDFLDESLYRSEVSFCVKDFAVFAEVLTDDQKMKKELDDYFAMNSALASRHSSALSTERIDVKMLYLTDHGVDLGDGVVLGKSGLPYEGIFSADGEIFFSVGRKSIGTYKSMVIGGMSGALAMKSALLPIHSSVVADPNGKAIAFSGRGNMGKTTSLLASFEILAKSGYKVLTDDWAMIDEETRAVYPVDYLMSVRPESLDGLGAIYRRGWLKNFVDRLINLNEGKPKSDPVGISEIFGANMIANTGILKGIILTSVNEIFTNDGGGHKSVNFTSGVNVINAAARIRDDAYHAPELPGSDFRKRYEALCRDLACSAIYTRAKDSDRKSQITQATQWLLGV